MSSQPQRGIYAVPITLPSGIKIQVEYTGGHNLSSVPQITTPPPVRPVAVHSDVRLEATIDLTRDMGPNLYPSVLGQVDILRKNATGEFCLSKELRIDGEGHVGTYIFRKTFQLDSVGEYALRMYVAVGNDMTGNTYWDFEPVYNFRLLLESLMITTSGYVYGLRISMGRILVDASENKISL
ncbi:hypothetical protein FQN51_001316 [Onygenales sp. PD_10]|nr:hypothetical protein FQN51_001316 [Onygenales sp. PD_10]